LTLNKRIFIFRKPSYFIIKSKQKNINVILTRDAGSTEQKKTGSGMCTPDKMGSMYSPPPNFFSSFFTTEFTIELETDKVSPVIVS
jgi:hypothetical protein